MALRKFTTSSSLRTAHVWGGGHTAETDPTRNGWFCRSFAPLLKAVGREDNGLFLFGRKNSKVVATMRLVGPFGNKSWDVAMYWATSAELIKGILTGHMFDSEGYHLSADFTQVQDYPGFGLTIIESLDRQLAALNESESAESWANLHY